MAEFIVGPNNSSFFRELIGNAPLLYLALKIHMYVTQKIVQLQKKRTPSIGERACVKLSQIFG